MKYFNYRLISIAVIKYIQNDFTRYATTKKIAAYNLFANEQYWIINKFNIDFVDLLAFYSE